MMEIEAAVLHDTSGVYTIETLELDAPRADELLVRMVGVGVCHTDVKVSKGLRPIPRPIVLGHEGSGVVEAVGEKVTKVGPGDHVVLTFPSCGECDNCRHDRPAYCVEVYQLSFGGTRRDGSTTLRQAGKAVYGPFFGQSSFASYSVTSERNVVKVSKQMPLADLGPLGCGFQTGAGAVLNTFQAEAGRSLAVFGVGSVGLSAVMAAAVAGCSPIIAVDPQPQRLELARELGATYIINPTEVDPVAAILDMTGQGVYYALDTSGIPAVFRQAFDSICPLGHCGLIGGMAPGDELSVEANRLLPGRTIRGIIQGDSKPDLFIPVLVELYENGRFPLEKLITFYDFADINQAVADMNAGKVIKPILQFGA
jgi:aryl-alcohol dehydrogenase